MPEHDRFTPAGKSMKELLEIEIRLRRYLFEPVLSNRVRQVFQKELTSVSIEQRFNYLFCDKQKLVTLLEEKYSEYQITSNRWGMCLISMKLADLSLRLDQQDQSKIFYQRAISDCFEDGELKFPLQKIYATLCLNKFMLGSFAAKTKMKTDHTFFRTRA